ncbi:MAG: Ig-like domain-containing protein, partial [Candidatus Jacksonbacteria bacterium]
MTKQTLSLSLSLSLGKALRAKIFSVGLTAILIVSGFFIFSGTALAAHTATVTVDPTLVKGGATGTTYIFTINKTSGNDIVYVKVEDSNFTNYSSVNCPVGWTSDNGGGTYARCTWPFEGDKISTSGIVSFTATAPLPVVDTNYVWTVTTKDDAGVTIINTTDVITRVDATSPTAATIITKDLDTNGKIDTAIIEFSEIVTGISVSDFTIGGVQADSVETELNDEETAAVATFTFNPGNEIDGTDEKSVVYSDTSVIDEVGNELASFTQASTDEAAPVAISAETKTTTTIEVTFSEEILLTSATKSDFLIGGVGLDNAITKSSELNPKVILNLNSPIGTAETPEITVLGDGTSGIKDTADNWTNEHSITPTDGIAPIISSTRTITTTSILVTFSEAMSAVDKTDFAVVGPNTIDSVTFSAGETIATLVLQTPIGTGDTPEVSTIELPAGTFDNADSPNAIAGDFTSEPEDGISPTVEITSTATSPTNTSPIPMTATFSEAVSEFIIDDIIVGNGTADNLATDDNQVFTFDVTPDEQGTVTVDIAGGIAQDSALNDNTVAIQFSIIYDSEPPATPTILTPNGGEYLKGGSSYEITWTPTSDTNLGVTPIKIEYSALGDFSDAAILADNEANDGTYSWNVPASNLATAKIRITATDLAGNSSDDVSDAAFTIDSTNPAILATTLLTPSNADINLKGDQSYDITWTNGDITDTNLGATPIKIEYSAVGDFSDAVVLADDEANDGVYSWTVPSSDLDTAKIRITAFDLAGNSASDVSDNAFLIDSTNPTVDAGLFAGSINIATAPTGATANDAGSGIATYAWTSQSAPFGGTLLFSDSTILGTTLAGSEVDGSYIALLTVTDYAGNESTDTVTFTWDTTAPTVGIILTDPALKAGETSLVTITFSEAVTDFDNDDITIDNGTLTDVSSADGGITWTATFTPTDSTTDDTNIITITKTGIVDL